MITIIYNEAGHDMILRAEGHAGYAEKGSDIVCAAVSTLMQTLAYSVDGGTIETGEGVNALTVRAAQSSDNMAKFELVTDGLMLLARQYPVNVRFVNLHADNTDDMNLQLFAATATTAASRNPFGALDLQRFADGAAAGGSGDGASAAAGDAGPAEIQTPALRPAQERLAKRSHAGRAAKAADSGKAAQPDDTLAGKADQSGAEEKAGPGDSQTGESEPDKARQEPSPAEKRHAFGLLMQGEYAAEFEEAMQRAAQMAVQRIQDSPQVKGLLDALGEAYGIDTGNMESLDALTEAVKSGRVKNDEYYETLAAQRGISVKTARELDRMEGELNRANAEKQRAQQMRLAAEHQQRAAAVRAQWEAEAAQLKNSYPDFELDEVLNNPAVADMIRRGVGLEAAYRAAYFDRLVENRVAQAAKQVEQGVAARIQQRSGRPTENGVHPGGAAEMKVDVAHMTKAQREELARRARRGERIVL